jgi:ribosome maturation factor RimP
MYNKFPRKRIFVESGLQPTFFITVIVGHYMTEQGEGTNKIVDVIKNLTERILTSEGMELVDMEFRQEGRKWVLRLFIDREGGVTLDDCVNISRQVGVALDVEDCIDRRYLLEVSSPGINRPLTRDRDFIKYAGKKVRIKTDEPIDGSRNFSGILAGFDDGVVSLTNDENKTVRIERKNIIKAKLDIDIVF